MAPPFIAEPDGCYEVHVCWLDPVDLDKAVADPMDKRYVLNKRSSSVHSKGWDSVPAASLDSWVDTTSDGAHIRIANTHKREIVSRQQSWILLARELGEPLGEAPLPLGPKRKQLRVGQTRKQPKKPKQKKRRPPRPATSHDSESEPLVAKAKPTNGKSVPNNNPWKTGKRKRKARAQGCLDK